MTAAWPAFLIAFGLAATHLFAGALKVLGGTPRSRWLSAAGGASPSYVFLHFLPDLAAAHRRGRVESETIYFIIALAGLVAFYGVERKVRRHTRGRGDDVPAGVFWLHVSSFALYNLNIGYLLLLREKDGLGSLVLFGVAIGFHFLSNDYGMRLDHPRAYDAVARWVLAPAMLLGAATGWATEVPRAALDGLFAFLAGGVVLNVMKEQLPEERQARFGAFLAGVLVYRALLLMID